MIALALYRFRKAANLGETLDPPSADVRAHVLEALGHPGYRLDDSTVTRAYRYLLAEQECDGSLCFGSGERRTIGFGDAKRPRAR